MLICDHCNVELPGSPERCPLCRNKPGGEPDETYKPYPDLKETRMTLSRTLVIWAAFAGICASAICGGINMALPERGLWSLFVIAGIVSFWIDFTVLLQKRRHLPRSIIWQVVLISIIALVWDIATGYRGWALDFVLPIVSTTAIFALVLVAKVQKLGIEDYISYLVIACIFGLVSFVLVLTGAVGIIIPSIISFVSAVVFLAFLLFFEGKALLEELRRRLHM